MGRFTKKVNDVNNKRYQASQASSYCGGLITGFNKNATAQQVPSPTPEMEEEDKQENVEDQELEEGEHSFDEITFTGETESNFFKNMKNS